MSYVRQMLDTYPRPPAVDADLLAAAIEASGDCAQACTADTDADLGEQNLAEMITCIRLCLDCTDICTATAAVLSRPAERDLSATRLLVGACAAICQSCGDECERHAVIGINSCREKTCAAECAKHTADHCRRCAEACRRCDRACRDLLDAWK